MKVIDLTHVITEEMPVYPGTEGPKLSPASSYEKDGFKETLISMYTHTGTHMDPPAHIFPGRKTLDRFPADHFTGAGCVIDCSHLNAGDRITMNEINQNRMEADKAEFLLFYTGWDRYWGMPEYFGDYPYIDEEVAEYIISSGKKGVGLDVIGIDPVSDGNLTIHKKLFGAGDFVIIENLTNLSGLIDRQFTLIALPLYLQEADGSPIRAIAMSEE